MAHFTIKEIQLHRLKIPLKQPFKTHLQSVDMRESIIIEMVDEQGHVGLGECVAFSSPWYTEETIQTCWDALTQWLIPSVLHQKVVHPEMLMNLMRHVKGNRMAKAALDCASWDLFAKRKNTPLWQLIGGVRSEIDAGIVLTGALDKKMDKEVKRVMALGYKRVKIKIDGTTDVYALQQVVSHYPSMQFFADANGIFTSLGMAELLKFDGVGLTLIEQPFSEDDWALHQQACSKMTTPLALDESIRSIADARRMIDTKAGDIIVLKPGRVGGLTESLHLHQLAKEHSVPVWMGGMIELGVSKAHNLALASLPQMVYPGDFSASNHFWENDIVKPFIEVVDGQIPLSDVPGIGYELDQENLKAYQIETTIVT